MITDREPDWAEVRQRLLGLTAKQLAPLKRHFNGCMGSAATKHEVVSAMVNQLRYWWRHVEGDAGRIRVRIVMGDIKRMEKKERSIAYGNII